MQFRLTRKHLVAINFLLIAGIAYFAARSVNDVILHSLEGSPALPPVESRKVGDIVTRTRESYEQIVTRDVFNLVPKAAPTVATSVDLQIKLLGISLSTRQKPFAIIEDQSGDQSLYTIGDEIPDAGTLLSVQKNQIIILSRGQRVALGLPKDELPGGVGSATGGSPRAEERGPRKRKSWGGER
jgi:type II secretory pathway component PulC